jgi:transposase InsO family protein
LALINSTALVHFDPSRPIVVSCDASPVGIGAVLAHVIDGIERPVMFISRSLSTAERNYSQVEKEGLSVIFAVIRLRQYLLGRHFVIWTDHKPLLALFDPDKRLPPVAAARVLRWSLILAAYSYSIKFRRGIEHGNADALSRLPLASVEATEDERPTEIVLFTDQMEDSPCSAEEIRQATQHDVSISQAIQALRTDVWPDPIPGHLMAYYKKRDELTITRDILLWGHRVVVPAALQGRVKQELHMGHFGCSHMKALARSYVWWPNIDNELEAEVAACETCQQMARDPPRTAVRPWPWPTQPWCRLHIDHAGPIDGKWLLIIIDAHSKWIEAVPVSHATAESTVTSLRHIFASHGLPEVIVSDNGTPFTSLVFAKFCKNNGIRHLRSPPYHPASNGLAERAVGTVKTGLGKLAIDTVTAGLQQQQGDTLQQRLDRFLLAYRRTPQSTTGVAPAELLMNRTLRTRLDLLRPSLASTVIKKQEKWPAVNKRDRSFDVDDSVWTRNYSNGNPWIRGSILNKSSPHSIVVQTENGAVHRHPDQLRSDTTRTGTQMPSQPLADDDDWLPITNTTASGNQATLNPLRRSQRQRHEPDRLNL